MVYKAEGKRSLTTTHSPSLGEDGSTSCCSGGIAGVTAQGVLADTRRGDTCRSIKYVLFGWFFKFNRQTYKNAFFFCSDLDLKGLEPLYISETAEPAVSAGPSLDALLERHERDTAESLIPSAPDYASLFEREEPP